MTEWISIAQDPNGHYVACDRDMNLYFWNFLHGVWIPIRTFSDRRREDT